MTKISSSIGEVTKVGLPGKLEFSDKTDSYQQSKGVTSASLYKHGRQLSSGYLEYSTRPANPTDIAAAEEAARLRIVENAKKKMKKALIASKFTKDAKHGA